MSRGRLVGLGGIAAAAAMIFAPTAPVPLGLGEARVTAQPSGTYLGRAFSVPIDGAPALTPPASAPPAPPSEAARTADAAREEAVRRAFLARFAALPPVDPRVGDVTPPPAPASTLRPAAGVIAAQGPGPRLGDASAVASNIQVDPPAGKGDTLNWPASTQGGRYGMLVWDSYAANFAAGTSGPYGFIDPIAYPPGMPDYGARQDVLYEPGTNTYFWLRLGGQDVGPPGDAQNRILLDMSQDAFSSRQCGVDLRPIQFGLTNAYLASPRLAVSSSYLYLTLQAYDYTNGIIGAFSKNVIARFDLYDLATCTLLRGTSWGFPNGWAPTLVSGARDVMYLGDHVVTSTGLNDKFRIYWIFEDNSALNFVDRTISPWLYTNGDAQCFIASGINPCASADHSITTGVVQHNSPRPGNTGSAGDKVDFYWNVKSGNSFITPYIESAGFHANSLTYIQRKTAWSNAVTYWDASAAADARGHVALAAQLYYGPSDPQAPALVAAIDDEFNGSPQTVGWSFDAVAHSNGAWPRVSRGTGVRAYLPTGLGWLMTGKIWDGAAQEFKPVHAVIMRARDLSQFHRYDPS